MNTRWIDLTTAAKILGVTDYNAEKLMTLHGICPEERRDKVKERGYWKEVGVVYKHYDAQAVEELAKSREAGKP